MPDSIAISILPSASIALKTLDRLEMEIQNAPNFETLDQAARTAAGLQLAFKPVKDVADRSGTVWVKAERRLAVELAKLPKATGGDAQRTRFGKGTESPPTRKELGVTKKRSAKAAKLAAIPEKKLDETIERLKAENKPVNPNTVLTEARREQPPHQQKTIRKPSAQRRGSTIKSKADTEEVNDFIRELTEFTADYSNRITAWHTAKPNLENEDKAAITRTIHQCADQVLGLAQVLDGR